MGRKGERVAEANRYCPNCNAYVPVGVAVCLACGHQIIQEQKPKPNPNEVVVLWRGEEVRCYVVEVIKSPVYLGGGRDIHGNLLPNKAIVKRQFKLIEM